MNGFMHGWGMGFGWFFLLLTIVAIVYLLQDKKTAKSDAQDILDKRYASGSISKEEYEEKSEQLRKYSA